MNLKKLFILLIALVLSVTFGLSSSYACDKCGKECKCDKAEKCDCQKECTCQSGEKCKCGKDCKCPDDPGCKCKEEKCGCEKQGLLMGDEQKSEKPAEKTEPVPADMIGKKMTCPVCKKEFTISKDTPFSIYKGKNYYFACAGCKTQFDKETEKFLKEEKKKEKK